MGIEKKVDIGMIITAEHGDMQNKYLVVDNSVNVGEDNPYTYKLLNMRFVYLLENEFNYDGIQIGGQFLEDAKTWKIVDVVEDPMIINYWKN